jgi:Signal peptidase, peptidase S26
LCDIGIFVYPNDRTQYYIKRVVGLPGDHISITSHQVLGAYADSLEHDPAQVVQLPWQPSAPAGSDARNMMTVIRIPLFIGIFMIMAIAAAGLLSSLRHRTRPTFARTGLLRRHPGQGFNPHW